MRSIETRTFTEQARRVQIVQGAIELVGDVGFAAASLASIAAHVGISKGAILYHFAGKDELLREIVSTVLADAADAMRAPLESAASPTEALAAYVRANLEFLNRHRRRVRALVEVLNGLPPGPDGAPAYEAYGRGAVAGLAELLEAGQRAGEFATFSVAVAATSLRASIDAVSGLLRTDPDLDVGAYAEELLELFGRAVLR